MTSPAGPATLAEALARIDGINADTARRLVADETDRVVIVKLLHTTVLLELSKLTTAPLGLASYIQLATDVIASLLPIDGCRLTIEDGAYGTFDMVSGSVLSDRSRSETVSVRGKPIGHLVIGSMRTELAVGPLFASIAEQLGTGLAVVGDAERLRRQVAVATATAAASSAAADDLERALDDLAHATASFPGALAAELTSEHPACGSGCRVVAGYWDDDGTDHPVAVIRRPTVRLRIRATRGLDELAVDALEAIVDQLVNSLDQAAHHQQLERENETDPLTGVGNRRRIERSLTAALARSERFGESVSVVLFDLDHFKRVNDTLGHLVGDEVLVSMAALLTDELRPYDEVGRFGGEEFVIVAPVTDVLGARRLAERVLAKVPSACVQVVGWQQTASAGVATCPDHGTENLTLLTAADAALYRAKSAGRNRVEIAHAAGSAEPVVAVHLAESSDTGGEPLDAAETQQSDALRRPLRWRERWRR